MISHDFHYRNNLATQLLSNQESTLSTSIQLRGIWDHLSSRRRIQLCMLLVVMLVSGVAEMVSLGAVLPFLAALNDPERLWQQPLVQTLANWVGLTSASQLLLPFTLAFAASSVLAALIRLALLAPDAAIARIGVGNPIIAFIYGERENRQPKDQQREGQ